MEDECKNLWFSVVKTAIVDYKGAHGPELHEEAESWLISSNEGIGSFLWICSILDMEPSYIRRICKLNTV